jgi:thioredoxin-related protein
MEYNQTTIIYKHIGSTKHINMFKQDFSTATFTKKLILTLINTGCYYCRNFKSH